MDFLPNDYKEPVESKYMKFQDGENRFRVLGSAVVGIEGWSKNKPVRWHLDEDEPNVEWDTNRDGSARAPKTFWAFPVWNYQDEKIQILEVTQKKIRGPIGALTKNPKWGSPFDYDIVVTRSGEGFDTDYIVAPDPKEEVSKEILEKYKKTPIDLEKLFTGEDPFSQTTEEKVDPDEVDF